MWALCSLFKALKYENDNFLVFTEPRINNSKRLKQVAAAECSRCFPFCFNEFSSFDTTLISCRGDSF